MGILELTPFIERDIARQPLNISSIEVRRLLTMLAHSHGGLVNHSTLGRSLGYSYHTIQSMLDLFAGYFLIRRLQPFHANVNKRLVKASKVYLRDSGNHRVGFEFKAGVATDVHDWKHLQTGIDDDVINRGYVVYNGTREFPVTDKISVIPATQLLSGRLP